MKSVTMHPVLSRHSLLEMAGLAATFPLAAKATGAVVCFPPKAYGGWRSLEPWNASTSALQNAPNRAKVGIDRDRLKRAQYCTPSAASHNAVLTIRNRYVAGEWGGARRWA
jgi:hypothetical protein